MKKKNSKKFQLKALKASKFKTAPPIMKNDKPVSSKANLLDEQLQILRLRQQGKLNKNKSREIFRLADPLLVLQNKIASRHTDMSHINDLANSPSEEKLYSQYLDSLCHQDNNHLRDIKKSNDSIANENLFSHLACDDDLLDITAFALKPASFNIKK